MAKSFTPVIGLAVVMALALAAVFGSMSLANPAMAAVGQPADGELSERTSAPQQAAAPTGLSVESVGSQTVMISLDYDSGFPAAANYEVSFRENSANTSFNSWVNGSGTGITFAPGNTTTDVMITIAHDSSRPLNNDQEYEFQVRTFDTVNNSAGMSALILATPQAAPSGALVATSSAANIPNNSAGRIEVKWEYTPAANSTPVDSWLYTATQQGGGTTVTDQPISLSGNGPHTFVITGLVADPSGYEVTLKPVAAPVNANQPGAIQATPLTVATSAAVSAATVLAMPLNVMAAPGDKQVELTWDIVASAASYTVTAEAAGRNDVVVMASTNSATVTGLTNDVVYSFTVVANPAAIDQMNASSMASIAVLARPEAVVVPPAITTSLEAGSYEPGEQTRYTFKFSADKNYIPGVDNLVVEFHEDFTVPGNINESSVNIQVGSGGNVTNPASVLVDGEEITLELGDLTAPDDGTLGMIEQGKVVTVIFKPSAGLKNPVEGGGFGEISALGTAITSFPGDGMPTNNKFDIIRKITLNEDEGGRGDVITVTGKGFKNGTSVHFLRMPGSGTTTSDFAAATSLCSDTASDGIASCEFTITSPLFVKGDNFINGIDGRSNPGTASKAFDLQPSISVSPKEGSPGDSLLVQLYDFGGGITVSSIQIARRDLCVPTAGGPMALMAKCGAGYTNFQPSGTSFRVVIPNDAPLGVQDINVTTSGGDDNDSIVITGPLITSTPSTVLANQRLSLVGNGFTAGGRIHKITFAGEEVLTSRIAGGNPVPIDNGGNWNASVNLPLNTSTVSAGIHAVQVTDTSGRVGEVKVTVPERRITITPDSGRVGTLAVVRGENFPSKNDEGNSFNVTVIYGGSGTGSTTVSAVPDASGRFEVQLRIPTTSAIPSTNDVTVSFGTATDGSGGPFTLNVSHRVPEGIITLSDTSGGAGSTITISGEGFRAFVPVREVTIGSIDITPAPRPSSDANGMLSFSVLIPGLDVGIQTVEVDAGQTTASAGFTVVESGVNPGDIVAVAKGVEDLGDNLDVIWHFNNDTKEWSFYDGQEGSTLTHLISGETYLIHILSSVEVILNRDTRSLTCVSGNCWNQIVW